MTLHERMLRPSSRLSWVKSIDHVTSIASGTSSGCGVSRSRRLLGNQAQVEPEFAVNAVDAFVVVFPAQDVADVQVA